MKLTNVVRNLMLLVVITFVWTMTMIGLDDAGHEVASMMVLIVGGFMGIIPIIEFGKMLEEEA